MLHFASYIANYYVMPLVFTFVMTWQATPMSRLDDLLDEYSTQMSVAQVAEVLGVTQRTVISWLKAGELPGFRLPNQWRVLREDLRQFLKEAYNIKDTGEDAPPRD